MPFSRECQLCGLIFETKRADALYCSPGHRNRAYRDREKAKRYAAQHPEPTETPHSATEQLAVPGSPVVSATIAELAAVQQATTAAGLGVLALAMRIDHPERETGSSLTALVKEHRAALQALTSTAKESSGDDVDEIARKRDERRRRAAAAT